MKNIINELKSQSLFKLILGVGNRNLDEIKKTVAIYAKAGANIFDITPDLNVIKVVKEGILYQGLNLDDFDICVSYPIGDDKHGKKAKVDYNKCMRCQKCLHLCRYGAISYNGKIIIDETRCIGCEKCSCRAISYESENIDICASINEMITEGANSIELHVSTKDKELVINTFENIKKQFPQLKKGVCISREKYSDTELIEFLSELVEINGEEKMIIQADGISMNGGKETYGSTLQAVAIAQILKDLNAYIIISGGTNAQTKELAKLCDVKINGISIGSYGRLLIKEEVNNCEFCYNKDVFNSALKKAKRLVESVKNYERNN